MRNQWCRNFDIKLSNQDWECVYKCKIKMIAVKKFAEFNFKLLNNILVSGYLLSKWNQSISKTCFCMHNDTTEHMLFSCTRIKNIWEIAGNILQLNITWKIIVLGLNNNNNVNIARNHVITIITYCIYATWITHHQPDTVVSYENVNLIYKIKSYLNLYKAIYANFSCKDVWFDVLLNILIY